MNSLFTKHRWMQVVWGILLFVAGAITIIFAVNDENTDVSLVLSIAVAIILFAYGMVIIFSSFLELKDGFFKYELIIGGFIIAIGIVFCMNTEVLKNIIVNTVAISLLVFGAIFGARAAVVLIGKKKVWWIWLAVTLAVLFIAGGILCLIFSEKVVNVCYFALGGILIVVGIIELYITVKRALEANSIGIEQKDTVKGSKKDKKKKEKKSKDKKPKNNIDKENAFDNEVEKVPEIDEAKGNEVPLIDASSEDDEEPKNEIIVSE